MKMKEGYIMRKILILFTLIASTFVVFSLKAHAEDVLTYPFDSIRIVSAFKFDILIEEEPLADSIFYGQVALDEVVTIYVGNLEFIFEGVPVSGSDSIMIVTNEAGVDIARWLINSGSSDLETYRNESFASWITINPTIGVIKDFTGLTISIGYTEDLITHAYTFKDNLEKEYTMITDSFVSEEGLDILISAYVAEDES